MSQRMIREIIQDADTALRLLDCDVGAVESHGMLCGMLCNPDAFDARVWLEHTTGRSDLTPFGASGSDHAMWEMLRATQEAIASDDFSFTLPFADEEDDFADAVVALRSWCRGFLSGFGLAGMPDLSALSEDCRGFVKDVGEFSKAEDDAVATEENEKALFEITEYLRIGVLMLREETRFVLEDVATGRTLH